MGVGSTSAVAPRSRLSHNFRYGYAGRVNRYIHVIVSVTAYIRTPVNDVDGNTYSP